MENSNDKDLTNQTSDFQGIWNRSVKPDNIVEQAQILVAPHPELGARKKVKQWGVKSVLLNFIVFLVVQVVVAFAAIAFFTAQYSGDPSKAITALGTSPWVIIVSSFAMYCVWVLGMLYVTHTKGQKSLAKDFKVRFKWFDPLLGLLIGAGLYLVILGSQWLFQGVLGLDMTGANNGATLTSFEGVWFLIIAIGIGAIVGPLCEELFFRGFVMRAFIRSAETYATRISNEEEAGIALRFSQFIYRSRNVIAVIISSVLFGFMHFQGVDTFGQWYVVLATGLLGLVLAVFALKLGRLGPVIFAHIAYNGGTILLATFLS